MNKASEVDYSTGNPFCQQKFPPGCISGGGLPVKCCSSGYARTFTFGLKEPSPAG